jgi:hypothetical protein
MTEGLQPENQKTRKMDTKSYLDAQNDIDGWRQVTGNHD